MKGRPVGAVSLVVLFVCCAVALSGCMRVQTADFSVDPLSGSKPLSVRFTPLVDGSVREWVWGFGDGTGSGERIAEHTYEETGVYSVFLTVVPWFGDPVTVLKDDCIQVKSSGFQDAPRELLARDDSFDLDHTLVVDTHFYFLTYRLDVLANDVRPSPTTEVTIVGVAMSAEGPFTRAMGPAQEAPSDPMAWGVEVTRDGKYLRYYFEHGVYQMCDDSKTFYYQLSDGVQRSVGQVSTWRMGPPAHL